MSKSLQGKLVSSEYKFLPANSESIVKDATYLYQNVYGPLSISPENTAQKSESDLTLLKQYQEFSDKEMQPVSAKYYEGKINPPIIWNKKTQANEYPKPTKKLFKKFAKNHLIDISVKEEHGGRNISKALLAVAEEVGFNTNTSFQLKETVSIGVLNLLSVAHKEANEDGKILISNVMNQLMLGHATGAMFLTEEETGANLSKMKCFIKQDEEGKFKLNGVKKYITGFTTGGIDTVRNAFGIVVSNTSVDGQMTNKSTVSLISLYKINEYGDLKMDKNGDPIPTKGIETSRYIDKPGIQGQILQMHEFTNVKAIVLGKPEQGWNMMFNVMDSARLGIATQAIGNISAAVNMAYSHTTKKHLNTGDGVPIGLRPQAINKINEIRAFTEVGRAVLMKIGTDIENSQLTIGDKKPDDRKIVGEAKALVKIESSFAKSYFTYKAKALANQAEQLLGADGYTSPQFQQIKNDVAPTPIYEGPNEMMAKQIVIQHFDKVKVFIKETDRFLKSYGTDDAGSKEVKNALRTFKLAHNMFESKRNELKDCVRQGKGERGEELCIELLAGSEKFLDHMGAVVMGREALRITQASARDINELNNETDIKTDVKVKNAKSDFLLDKIIIAKSAINNFVVGQYPTSQREVEKQYFTSKKPELTNSMEGMITESIKQLVDSGKIEQISINALKARANIVRLPS